MGATMSNTNTNTNTTIITRRRVPVNSNTYQYPPMPFANGSTTILSFMVFPTLAAVVGRYTEPGMEITAVILLTRDMTIVYLGPDDDDEDEEEEEEEEEEGEEGREDGVCYCGCHHCDHDNSSSDEEEPIIPRRLDLNVPYVNGIGTCSPFFFGNYINNGVQAENEVLEDALAEEENIPMLPDLNVPVQIFRVMGEYVVMPDYPVPPRDYRYDVLPIPRTTLNLFPVPDQPGDDSAPMDEDEDKDKDKDKDDIDEDLDLELKLGSIDY